MRGPGLVYLHQAKIKLLTRGATEIYGNKAIRHMEQLLELSAQAHLSKFAARQKQELVLVEQEAPKPAD